MKNTCLLFFLFLLGIQSSKAQYADIHDFNGLKGANPQGSLTVSGNKLYGMTDSGGAYKYGCIFSINTDGSGYKDLLDFNGTSTPQGAYPYGSLILSGGVLYGMTSRGGSGINNYGCIFSVDTNGTGYKEMYSFDDSTSGELPRGSLILIANKLFGMTTYGNVIFSINPDGSNYRILSHAASFPWGSLTFSGSKLYGLTVYGGGYGSVFSVDTNGSNYKNLCIFPGMPLDTDGIYPYGSLLISGNIMYGMTFLGGESAVGRIFSIDTDGGNYRDMHDFNGTNGGKPFGSLIQSSDLLYGMTNGGGINTYGCIFSINMNDTAYTDIYDLNGTEGMYPYGDLVLSGNTLYGMTSSGGANDSGVIFSFKSPELGIKEVNSSSCFTNIYPNPSNGIFNFVIASPGAPGGTWQSYPTIEIYNTLGQKIKNEELRTTSEEIDLSSQPNGLYLYRVLNIAGDLLGSGKFVIER